MKRLDKGFTLIELLAVIVVIAIIALIATPIVLKIIDSARKGAAQNSAYGVKKSAELYYSTVLVNNPEGLVSDVVFSCNGKKCGAELDLDKDSVNDYLDINGSIPTSGKVIVRTDGTIAYNNLVINNFNCVYNDNKFTCKKGENSNVITVGDIITTINSVTIPFNVSDVNDVLTLNNIFLPNMLLDIELDSSISVKCEYGLTEKYGKTGVLGNNSCLLPNLNANTKYYYKITYTNSNGKSYIQKGNANTNSYTAGEVVYLNPITGKACYNYNLQNSNTGYNGTNNDKSQNECMKWYIVSINDDSIELIADHNITYGLKWPDAFSSLQSSTSSWKKELNPKLISPDTIAKITNANSSLTLKWDSNKIFIPSSLENKDELDIDCDTGISWFYLDGSGTTYNWKLNGWQFKDTMTSETSKFSWLFDNTYECLSYGCLSEDNNQYYNDNENDKNIVMGYYTDKKITEQLINNNITEYNGSWVIMNYGALGTAPDTMSQFGIRPVITVKKESLIELDSDVDFDMDTIPPVVTLSIANSNYGQNTIKIEISDNLSLINKYCVTPINDLSKCNFIDVPIDKNGKTNSIIYKNTIISDKTYYVFAKDESGNVSDGYPIYLPKIKKYDISSLNIPKTYSTGTTDEVSIIYFDPAENELCTVEDYDKNLIGNYSITNGCLKWYVIEDSDENSPTVDVILDHNVYFDSANEEYLYLPYELIPKLEFSRREIPSFFKELKDYAGWKVEPRLISANTIANIIGAASNDTLKWSTSKNYGNGDNLDTISWLYLDGAGNSYDGWKNQIANKTNKSRYSWLYDNLYECEQYGCMHQVLPTEANYQQYLTIESSRSQYYDDVFDWIISNDGTLNATICDGCDAVFGIRPVITIKKN